MSGVKGQAKDGLRTFSRLTYIGDIIANQCPASFRRETRRLVVCYVLFLPPRATPYRHAPCACSCQASLADIVNNFRSPRKRTALTVTGQPSRYGRTDMSFLCRLRTVQCSQ